MAFVDVHPEFRQWLTRQGLATAADFLALPSVVCSGHLDRNVARVTLSDGQQTIPALLKREHRTRWRDRLTNAWAGFGFASKSLREYAFLRTLESTGIGSPQPLAAGEDNAGRAFLLVREMEHHQDLRHVLRQMPDATLDRQRFFARALGAALAQMHSAGFEHGDFYSKHILVSDVAVVGHPSFCFLDWQRARQRKRVAWTRRWRDLAALDATLADDLATPRQRLRVLHAYMRECRTPLQRAAGLTLAAAAHEIRRRSLRLLERRRIREMRQPALALGTQNLIWLDGEALQITREFRDELGPDLAAFLKKGPPIFFKKEVRPLLRSVALPGSGFAQLASRWASQPWRWLWAWLRRRPLVAPELESMKVIFHLERYGVVLPRLLAAGQKSIKPWEIQSFLLTAPLPGAVPLPEFLSTANFTIRRHVLREAGRFVRQIHQATCYASAEHCQAMGQLLSVFCRGNARPTVALATVHGIEKTRHAIPVRAHRDLATLVQALGGVCSKTDLLRGLLSYIGQPRLTPAARQFARRVLRRLPSPLSKRRIAA